MCVQSLGGRTLGDSHSQADPVQGVLSVGAAAPEELPGSHSPLQQAALGTKGPSA